MLLSQTKVVDYTVKWLESQGWNVIYAHYPEGHHISLEYGRLKIIKRRFIDVIAKKGRCLFLIQCNRHFKKSYFEKLRDVTKEDIKEIEFDILLRGVSYNIPPSNEEKIEVMTEGCLLLEVKGENMVKLYGKIPKECEG